MSYLNIFNNGRQRNSRVHGLHALLIYPCSSQYTHTGFFYIRYATLCCCSTRPLCTQWQPFCLTGSGPSSLLVRLVVETVLIHTVFALARRAGQLEEQRVVKTVASRTASLVRNNASQSRQPHVLVVCGMVPPSGHDNHHSDNNQEHDNATRRSRDSHE